MQKHFSHRHGLVPRDVKAEDEIRTLLRVCPRNGNAFVYHCSACEFDLHVECAFPKETVNGQGHESYADQLRAHSEMQDALAACQLESEIARRSRQAMLDSVDPPNVERRYYYY
ncbi:hypothetical protein RJ639_039823 [Escallonia herrerae]|uniref:DC1 domain-containing protein n=1 Tax=Escallonia herrerae TaxID=1293975 RepID=A0AA89B5C1_9ASTE|nr:hypothetical protein RJ639_039823 [Escallonia herrerae]